MFRNRKVTAVIPARGGSTRVKRKNIAYLNGKPLIYWTIKVAQESELIDRIVVSTEDDEVTKIAKKYGVEVLPRLPSLATDKSKTEDFLIMYINNFGLTEDYFILLQPTSPLRTVKDIENGFAWMEELNQLSTISTYLGNPDGCIYISEIHYFLKNGFKKDNGFLAEYHIDINTYEDINTAEQTLAIMKRLKK